MRFTSALTLFIGLAAAAPAADDARRDNAIPPSKEVTIESINYAGTGCPANSVAGTFSDDRTLVTLAFDNYVAQSGNGVQPAENRKACQLTLKLHFPGGWQFSIFKADYRGFVSLPAHAKSFCSSTYYFSGSSETTTRSMWFQGPVQGNGYFKSDEIGLESTVWSPCGKEGLLNIKSQVGILPLGSTAAGMMTVDSTDLKVTQEHHLQWRRC